MHRKLVFGEAAETCSSIGGIDKYLVLADGLAGIRIVQKYGIDEKGQYRLSEDRDKIMERAYKWIPLFVSIIIVAVVIAVAHGTRFGNCLSCGNSIFALVIIFLVFYVALKNFTKFLTTKFSGREFGIEHVFKRFQAGTSCLIGFAVGSNDVANSVKSNLRF